MGSTLKVEPMNRTKKSLPDDLKFILRKKLGGRTVLNHRMDEADIPYLKGLVDCEVKGAFDLIEMIEKYDEVVIDEEF